MLLAKNCEAVSADLVSDITIFRNSVGAYDSQVDHVMEHEVTGHIVGNERARDLLLHEFPRGQSRALEHGTGLVNIYVDLFPGFNRGPHYAFRSSVSGSGNGAG